METADYSDGEGRICTERTKQKKFFFRRFRRAPALVSAKFIYAAKSGLCAVTGTRVRHYVYTLNRHSVIGTLAVRPDGHGWELEDGETE